MIARLKESRGIVSREKRAIASDQIAYNLSRATLLKLSFVAFCSDVKYQITKFILLRVRWTSVQVAEETFSARLKTPQILVREVAFFHQASADPVQFEKK